jgi:putative tryptophan/tyrosine transport system substrate-binding protein
LTRPAGSPRRLSPEANIPGASNVLPATSAKLLELLKSVAPNALRVIVVRDPDNAGKWLEVRELQAGGPALSLAVEIVNVRNAEEIGALLSRSLLTEGR